MPVFLLRWRLWMAFGFWLFPFGLSAAPKPTDAVAEVDGHPITVEEVQKRLAGSGAGRPDKKPEDLKREAVNDLINLYLTDVRARVLQVENDTVFMRRADHLLNQTAAREIFNQAVLAAITVSDSEAVERYQQKPENYQEEAWVHASHILIAPVQDTLLITVRQKETGWWAKTDDGARAIADSLGRMIQAGHSVDSLAKLWSQDMASGINGGDLGFFSPGQMVPAFDSAAFRLPVGSVSSPVKTQFGFHLIKVFSRQKRRTAPLSDSLNNTIKQQILNEKVIDRSRVFLDSLHRAAGLLYNKEIFGRSDSALQTEKIWAAASRFGDTVWSDRFGAQLVTARPIAPGGQVDREYKIGILKELINTLLIRRAAKDLKIDESEAYLSHKEQIFQNERLGRVLKEASLNYNPTEDEIKEYYRLHRQNYLPSESLSVHVQQMVFKTRKEAERVVQEIQVGGDFALLARKYFPGDSDIAQEAFDLGFISPPSMPKDFFAVAETLTVGAVSQPVRTRWGYHLVRVLARRPDLSFEEARPKIVVAIRKAKQEEHKRKWEETLREGHVISVKERVLKSIKYEPSRAGVLGRP